MQSIIGAALGDAIFFGLGFWFLGVFFRDTFVPRASDDEPEKDWRARQPRDAAKQGLLCGIFFGLVKFLDGSSALFVPAWTDNPAIALGLTVVYFGAVAAVLVLVLSLCFGRPPADVTKSEWRARIYRFGALAFIVAGAAPVFFWLIKLVL